MTASIVILSGNCLCNNPRVLKEATALARAGFDVEVLGAWLDPSLKARDRELLARIPLRFTPVVDVTQSRLDARLRRVVDRFHTKAAHLAYRFAGMATRSQFGPVIGALRKAALRRNADLFIAHSEPALVVALDLLESGRRVGVDMEDWFSEDLPLEARKHRPVGMLSDFERRLLRQSSCATCPSESMSEGLSKTYGCAPPVVIYNAFPWADRMSIHGDIKDRADRRIASIHWYSQTIGHGRGLEDLLAALPRLRHDVELHLRGTPVRQFDAWLSARVPEALRHRVFVHGVVSEDELLSRIAEHDIGFAGETRDSRSRNLTVTNKILHYLLAGLAVVASDTEGQREVAARAAGAVFLYPSGDAAALAGRLNALLESHEMLGDAKAAALRAAEGVFCWELQEATLLSTIGRAARASVENPSA